MSPKSSKPEQKQIFSTIDPQGRIVTLSTYSWDHIKERPEIKRAGLHRVKKTVEDPFYIMYNEPRTSLVYTDYTDTGLFINVFAKSADDLRKAFIRTCYLTNVMPPGGVIWQKPPQKKKKKRKKPK